MPTDPPPARSNNPETLKLQVLDAAHHFHPQTNNMRLQKRGARVITHGKGIYVWDSEGRRMIDGMAGLWCLQLGYGREELAEAARAAMLDLPFYNTFFQTTHPYVAKLAARIAGLTPPGLDKILFHTSGSESTDTAAKFARAYWRMQKQSGRKVILSRELGYHGSTMAAASMTGIPYLHKHFGLPLPGFAYAPTAYSFRDGKGMSPEAFGALAAKRVEEKILAIGPKKIAAFIAEPVQGAGGLIVPPPGYWPAVTEILKRYDILFIADEVICGFGRTGRWFGSQTYDLKPDMMTLAKGLTSGYVPLSALVMSPRIADVLAREDIGHGMTYEGHPVASAVALATIDIIDREGLVDRVRERTGPYLQRKVAELADHPLVGETRGIGLLAAIELVADKATGERFPEEGKTGLLCRDFCFDNGLIMRSIRDTMVLSPPLIITENEIDEMIAQARVCLDLTAKALGRSI
ncbi:MAG: aminotransferase [Alphaproteobacteria bacterium]